MDQGRLRLEEREGEAAAVAQAERPVGIDRVDAEADLVQVCDDDDRSVALPDAHPEIAGRVGLGLNPGGQQPLHGGSDGRLHA